MKKFVAIVAILAAVFSESHAQNYVAGFVGDDQLFLTPISSTDPKPRGLRQRNIGRALTIGGAATMFAGVLIFTDARKGQVIANGQVTQEPEYGKMQAGIIVIEAGIGMIVPGIILWKRGQRKYTRYLEEQSVSFNTTGSSFSLRYKF